jgi:hypothetical protein
MSVGEPLAPAPRGGVGLGGAGGGPLGGASAGGGVEADGAFARLRRWAAPRQARLGLAGLLLCGLVVALAADQTGVLLPQSVGLGLPRSLSGAFGAHLIDLGYPGVAVVFALMFFSYLAAVRASDQLSAATVAVCMLVLYALVLLGPPLISTDVFSYIAYGRLGSLYHANPYLYGPSANPLDPVYPLIDSQWISTPTVYGPAFTAISYLLTPLDVAAGVLAYKAIATASALVVVACTWLAARVRGADRVHALVLVGLNPILIVYGIAGGHNDLLMLALMMAGLLGLLYGFQRGGGALLVAAVAVKLTAFVLVPFAMAREGARAGAEGARRRRALGAALIVCAALAAGLSAAMFGAAPLHMLATLQSIQRQGGVHSIPGVILVPLGLGGLLGPAGVVLDGLAAMVCCRLVIEVWRGRVDWVDGAGWATVALLVSTELLLPWYVTWLLPLSALARDRRLVVVSLLLTAACLTTL